MFYIDPLRHMCAIQLENGAVHHDSKAKALAEGTWKGDRHGLSFCRFFTKSNFDPKKTDFEPKQAKQRKKND